MLYTSLAFAIFLPLVLGGSALVAPKWRWLWLLLALVVFYGWDRPENLIFLGTAALLTYALGIAVASVHGRQRAWMIGLGLVLLLGSLVVFKFYDVTSEAIAGAFAPDLPRIGFVAPAGYSFYVFTAAGYLIDVYRRDTAESHPGYLTLFVAWFPKVLVGPIERAKPFLNQVTAGLKADPTLTVAALQLFFWGLFKKVVIADNLAPVVDAAFKIAPYATPLELLIAVYFFAFQIYCDFSGIADMTIGMSQFFGISLSRNFRRPYFSTSVTEFWSQRWHITLGHWFRDYLYIPLGGSRAGTLRTYLNVLIVFVVSGIWHAGLGYGVGWNFLVWGVLNALYQWVEMALRSAGQRWNIVVPDNGWTAAFRVFITFHLILVSWVFFRAASTGEALLVLQRVATGVPDLPAVIPHFQFTSAQMEGVALILFLLLVEWLDGRKPVAERLLAWPLPWRWSAYYAVLGGIVLLGSWQGARFIYMQF